MRYSFARLASASAISLAIAFAAVPALAKTVKECNAEYAANKDAIKASGEKKKDFVEACRGGTETIPSGAATAPASAPERRRSPAVSRPQRNATPNIRQTKKPSKRRARKRRTLSQGVAQGQRRFRPAMRWRRRPHLPNLLRPPRLLQTAVRP